MNSLQWFKPKSRHSFAFILFFMCARALQPFGKHIVLFVTSGLLAGRWCLARLESWQFLYHSSVPGAIHLYLYMIVVFVVIVLW